MNLALGGGSRKKRTRAALAAIVASVSADGGGVAQPEMIVNNARIAQCQWFFMRRKPPSFFTERQ
jgi:hypothetical protein